MYRNLVSSVIVTVAVAFAATAAIPSKAYAQSSPACSEKEQGLIASNSKAAVEALVGGNFGRYITLLQELDTKLSSSCLALQAVGQPARTKCSADEKKTALADYQAMLAAVLNLDLMQVFQLSEHLEKSVSQQCWNALNYPQDPGMQRACTSSELNLIASAATPLRRATELALTQLDFSGFAFMQSLNQHLSENCQVAWMRANNAAGGAGGNNGAVNRPSGVIDHGGGTFSAPGVGACTPSGCMAF